jgi:hypothetical protein
MPPPADTALFPTITHPKKRAWLLTFAACGSIKKTARALQTDHKLHYYWLAHDPTYLDAFDAAKHLATQTLADEAVRRGRDGLKRAVYYKGQIVGYEREYSDTLLIFLLKAWQPEIYGDKTKHDHVVSGDITVTWQARLTRAHTALEERRNGHAHAS